MPERARPVVAAVEMGYGHLRAALPIAEALGVPLVHADRGPLAAPGERGLWDGLRSSYELISRLSQLPLGGRPLRFLLDRITDIPTPHPRRDLSGPSMSVRLLELLLGRGLGSGLVAELSRSGGPLLSTYFAPALAADRARLPNAIFCVVTDSDVNRAWAPLEPRATRIRYLVPTRSAGKRLAQYGVPSDRIAFTGFPLPHELVGGAEMPALKGNLARRLVRLDPRRAFRKELAEDVAHFLGPMPGEEEGAPPLLTFAVGGAGAQIELARQFLPSLRERLLQGRLRIALVAGTKASVKAGLEECLAAARLGGEVGRSVEVLFEAEVLQYFSRFNQLLARTDVLWTKPSELSFFAALGLPVVCAAPVGVHERRNRRWVRESGAGVKQRDPSFAAEWLGELLDEGELAAAAWSGYIRLPKLGLYRIVAELGRVNGP